MRKSAKCLSVLLAVVTMVASTAGCTEGQQDDGTSQLSTQSTVSVQEKGQEQDGEKVKLTVWSPLCSSKVTNFDDNTAWAEAQKATGVDLVFEHPSLGGEKESFNLMMASDSLPDMINCGWDGDDLYLGGGDKYITDGVLIRLNELAKDYAPDYLKCIETFVPQEERKDFYSDGGNMFQFYGISPYEEWTFIGIMYVKSIMEELKLTTPETIDEIEEVLTALQKDKKIASPMVFTATKGVDGTLAAAYGIGPAFYQKDGVVKYGPTQPEFKDYLTRMAKWYSNKLIDQDFPTRDVEGWQRLMLNGEAAVMTGSPDTVGTWMKGDVIGGAYPVLKKGERVQYRVKNSYCRKGYNFAITTACKNPEAAAKFLNYGYTPEGWTLYNYGLEGDTYEKLDGVDTYKGVEFPKIKYNDKMLADPVLGIDSFKVHIGSFVRLEHTANPTMSPVSAKIREFWTGAADTNMNLPLISMNAEEGKEYSRIMNQIQTFQDTAVLQFIMGLRSIDTFDEYIKDMEKLEINKVIEIQQASLERYKKR